MKNNLNQIPTKQVWLSPSHFSLRGTNISTAELWLHDKWIVGYTILELLESEKWRPCVTLRGSRGFTEIGLSALPNKWNPGCHF